MVAKSTNFQYNTESYVDLFKLAQAQFEQGRYILAQKSLKEYLKYNKNDVEAIRLLSHVVYNLGFLYESESLMEKAVGLEPDDPLLNVEYASVMRRNLDLDSATEIFKEVYESRPKDENLIGYYAQDLMYRHEFEKARDILIHSNNLHVLKGHCYKALGKTEDAIYHYKKSDKAEAYFSLANLKSYQFTDEQIDEMIKHLDEVEQLEDKIYLNFALGYAYEQREDYEKSATHYSDGNIIKRWITSYSTEIMKNEIEKIKSHDYQRVIKEEISEFRPIFIVGLPRSGSTLLQQILNTDVNVGTTTELPVIMTQAQELRGQTLGNSLYPGSIANISEEDLQALANQYVDYAKKYSNRQFVIDKMPSNFMHIGLIKTMFPNALIIDIRKDKEAACFSVWKQWFAAGHEYSYDYNDALEFYDMYVDLMDYWNEQFPDQILTVSYEELIRYRKHILPKIFAYCGLHYDENSLLYHQSGDIAITPSSEQVKEPLHGRAIDHWKNYEEFLNDKRKDHAMLENRSF